MAKKVISNKSESAIKGEELQRPKIPFFSETNTAEGAESKIVLLTKSIEKINNRINIIYQGEPYKDAGIKFPGNKKRTNGIVPILLELNQIDFCNLTNYILNKISFSNVDNPIGTEKTINTLQEKSKNLIKIIDSILTGQGALFDQTIKINTRVTVLETIPGLNYEIGDTFEITSNELSIVTLNKNKFEVINTKGKEALLAIRDFTQEISSIIDDPDVLSLVPQLSQGNNFITDFLGKADKYVTLENIPNEELQKILKKLRDLRNILTLIVGIQSIGDALAAAQTLSGINIQGQVDKIQKSLDVSRIIPIIKKIINIVDNINQQGQKVLKYVRLALIYVKIGTILLKVLKAIIKLFKRLPLPLKFLLFGKATRLNEIWVNASKKIDDAVDRLKQLSTLIQLIYTFIQGLLVKLQNINKLLQTLQNNLEVCENTQDSPILEEVKNLRSRLTQTISDLQEFTKNYDQAIKNNVNTYGGFILEIQEEEVVDEGIKYNRRRGVAFDVNGILVAQTDLTFATDKNIIIEELKLKLQNSGLIQSPGSSGSGFPDLDQLTEDITIDFDFIDQDIEEEDTETKEIQQELDSVLDGINNLPKLRRRIRAKVNKEIQTFKQDVQQGDIPNINTNNITNSINISGETQSASKGNTSSSNASDILSDEDRTKLQRNLDKVNADIRYYITLPPVTGFQDLGRRAALNKLYNKKDAYENILKKDRIARGLLA
jgi:hypothetical protein